MKTLLKSGLAVCLLMLSVATFAQDQESTTDSDARAERQARIKELRQLTREEQKERRQEFQKKFENMSEEEKQAVRERRQQRQANRPEGQRQRPPGQRMRPQASPAANAEADNDADV